MIKYCLSILILNTIFVSKLQKSRKALLLILFLYSLQTDMSRDFYRN